MSSVGSDEMCGCPYDATHRMLRKNLQKHLMKCKRNHPDSELRQCPFNTNHLVSEADYVNHVTNCRDKALLLDYVPPNAIIKEEDEVIINMDPIVGDENWDEWDEVIDYDPKKYINSKKVIRMPPSNLKKSEKKEFYKAERKRWGGRDIDSDEELKSKKDVSTGFYKYDERIGKLIRVQAKDFLQKSPKRKRTKSPTSANVNFNEYANNGRSNSSKHPGKNVYNDESANKASSSNQQTVRNNSDSNEMGRYTVNTSRTRGYGRGRFGYNNRHSFQKGYRNDSPTNQLYSNDISSPSGYGRARGVQTDGYSNISRKATSSCASMSVSNNQEKEYNYSPPPPSPPPFRVSNHEENRNYTSRDDYGRGNLTNFSCYNDETQRLNNSPSPPPPPPFNRYSAFDK